ncbi:MAG: hypothetical protein Q4A28_08520 [Brachymonas sp.]|nr:hypothetical protein [Brachymonas sp.]
MKNKSVHAQAVDGGGVCAVGLCSCLMPSIGALGQARPPRCDAPMNKNKKTRTKRLPGKTRQADRQQPKTEQLLWHVAP